jgi:hypothetical protein
MVSPKVIVVSVVGRYDPAVGMSAITISGAVSGSAVAAASPVVGSIMSPFTTAVMGAVLAVSPFVSAWFPLQADKDDVRMKIPISKVITRFLFRMSALPFAFDLYTV